MTSWGVNGELYLPATVRNMGRSVWYVLFPAIGWWQAT